MKISPDTHPKDMLILVDKNDKPIGTKDKLTVHKEGLLHRAVSVILITSDHKVLLQRRAMTKYHSPGKWANTCCTHPMWNEDNIEACKRRLKEELGIESNQWFYWKTIHYVENVGNGMIENEIDHVYLTFSDEHPSPNPREVMQYTYIPIEELKDWIKNNKSICTFWSTLVLKDLNLHLLNSITDRIC